MLSTREEQGKAKSGAAPFEKPNPKGAPHDLPGVEGRRPCNLFVQRYVDEGTVNFQAAIVFNEAQLPELIHKLMCGRVVSTISASVS